MNNDAPFERGQLVAVMCGVNNDQVRRICRVVDVTNTGWAIVESDSKIEGDAAVEHDFETPQPWSGKVRFRNLRHILE